MTENMTEQYKKNQQQEQPEQEPSRELQPQERKVLEKQASRFLKRLQLPTPVMEEFQRLKTFILFEKKKETAGTLLAVTSAWPKEGVSYVSFHSAISLARGLENSVLLVDANFRKPSLHTIFNNSNTVGLSDILRGSIEPYKVIKPSYMPYLSFLPFRRAADRSGAIFPHGPVPTVSRVVEEEVRFRHLRHAFTVEVRRQPGDRCEGGRNTPRRARPTKPRSRSSSTPRRRSKNTAERFSASSSTAAGSSSPNFSTSGCNLQRLCCLFPSTNAVQPPAHRPVIIGRGLKRFKLSCLPFFLCPLKERGLFHRRHGRKTLRKTRVLPRASPPNPFQKQLLKQAGSRRSEGILQRSSRRLEARGGLPSVFMAITPILRLTRMGRTCF